MKKIKEIMEALEEGRFTALEIVLAGAVLFLSGIIIGIFFTPRKFNICGNFNGNNGSISSDDGDDDFEYVEEDEVIED